jgi:GT2 family glycosyltransferase
MAFRRAVLERIGGFDDALGAGTPFYNEDVDAAARASAAGAFGGYFPGPTVSHHHRRRRATEIETLWKNYHRGRGAYYAKCILVLPVRARYLRHWLRSIAATSWRTTAAEMAGALEYCVRRAAGRLT